MKVSICVRQHPDRIKEEVEKEILPRLVQLFQAMKPGDRHEFVATLLLDSTNMYGDFALFASRPMAPDNAQI